MSVLFWKTTNGYVYYPSTGTYGTIPSGTAAAAATPSLQAAGTALTPTAASLGTMSTTGTLNGLSGALNSGLSGGLSGGLNGGLNGSLSGGLNGGLSSSINGLNGLGGTAMVQTKYLGMVPDWSALTQLRYPFTVSIPSQTIW